MCRVTKRYAWPDLVGISESLPDAGFRHDRRYHPRRDLLGSNCRLANPASGIFCLVSTGSAYGYRLYYGAFLLLYRIVSPGDQGTPGPIDTARYREKALVQPGIGNRSPMVSSSTRKSLTPKPPTG